MKSYCPICDKVDWIFHSREHLNWEEFATPEKIAQVEDRRNSWLSFMLQWKEIK